MGATGTTALSVEHVSKTFPGTRALTDVRLQVDHGSVRALLGHNGSGKSTLVKVLSGFHQPDPGASASLDGVPFDPGSAEEAAARGLRFVHQDLALVLELSAVDNVAMTIGYSRGRLGTIDRREQSRRTLELLASFGLDFDVDRPLSNAAPVERTAVAIARALFDWNEGPRVVIMDEPTAALPATEVARLFAIIREVKAAGHAIVYVSHRLDEIFEIADDVTVLSGGLVVVEGPVSDQSRASLATEVAGHVRSGSGATGATAQARRPRTPRAAAGGSDPAVLEVEGLRSAYLDGVDIQVRRGEILGIAGLLGSGRDELPYVLAGANNSTSEGGWRIEGSPVEPPTTRTSQSLGIAFVPADRDHEGLISDFTVRENLTLAALPRLRAKGRLAAHTEAEFAERWLAEVGVGPELLDRPITTLSGGNRQRVLLARWLCVEPSLLILSEPTAGVDVGARSQIYNFLEEMTDRGIAVLLASSDIEDLVTVCDRVLVMRDGRVAAEMSREQSRGPEIIAAMEGTQ
jgi:ribose transport system ATP-binding protein